jgi:hypothetical protein
MTFERRGQQPDHDKYNEESPKLSVPKKVEPPKLDRKERRERILPGTKGPELEPRRILEATEEEIRKVGEKLLGKNPEVLDKFVTDTLLAQKIAGKLINSAGQITNGLNFGETVRFKKMSDKLLNDTDPAVVEKVLIRLATQAAQANKNIDNEKDGA